MCQQTSKMGGSPFSTERRVTAKFRFRVDGGEVLDLPIGQRSRRQCSLLRVVGYVVETAAPSFLGGVGAGVVSFVGDGGQRLRWSTAWWPLHVHQVFVGKGSFDGEQRLLRFSSSVQSFCILVLLLWVRAEHA